MMYPRVWSGLFCDTPKEYNCQTQLVCLPVREEQAVARSAADTSRFYISDGFCTLIMTSSDGKLINLNPHRFPDYEPDPEDKFCSDLPATKWTAVSGGYGLAASLTNSVPLVGKSDVVLAYLNLNSYPTAIMTTNPLKAVETISAG